MEVGVQLPEVEREVRWPELLEIARTAAERGFDSIWLGDHMLYHDPERGPWDVWAMLAALAASTKRVKLGPLVAAAAFHEPGVVARMAAAVDEVSGGRFVLGLGTGWNETEFGAFGFPFDHKVSRFEEAFEIVRRLLAGEHVTFEGTYHRVHDAVLLPPPARRVPLMVGGHGARLLRVTLPYVETWNTWYTAYGNTPEGFAELSRGIDVRKSACVLVTVDGGRGERPPENPVPLERLPAHLEELAGAGADEAILVLDPIDAVSVTRVAETLF
jgi:alkanesulfonate monooxygenase SsuD/methylene tetrahydromethanopterin reductase-like flavin-dependent oxidoreductase (luciferase family)